MFGFVDEGSTKEKGGGAQRSLSEFKTVNSN
jgi:hypothetical protein